MFNALPGVRAARTFPNEAGQPLLRCEVQIDPRRVGITRDELIA